MKEINTLREYIQQENEKAEQIEKLMHNKNVDEKANIKVNDISRSLKTINEEVGNILKKINLAKPLPTIKQIKHLPEEKEALKKPEFEKRFDAVVQRFEMEREVIKRLRKKKETIIVKREKKPNFYAKLSNNIFIEFSRKLIHEDKFKNLRKNLIKSNINMLPTSYISMIFFTTLISFIVAIGVFIFLLFFSITPQIPFIVHVTENVFTRIGQILWIILVVPLATFLLMYSYPSMERKSLETGINQEMPFVTIHMAAIAESMLEPSKIFKIIIETHEYPHIEKEFTKLINLVNIYGYDLVSALKESAENTSSKKLGELFNSIATTITSGSDLSVFFNKRAESLLFDYRLEREKYSRAAETFMDIYISVVIAAPMIFMLLLIMIKISGLGLNISTQLLTMLIIMGVATINIIFLVFLHLKQPSE